MEGQIRKCSQRRQSKRRADIPSVCLKRGQVTAPLIHPESPERTTYRADREVSTFLVHNNSRPTLRSSRLSFLWCSRYSDQPQRRLMDGAQSANRKAQPLSHLRNLAQYLNRNRNPRKKSQHTNKWILPYYADDVRRTQGTPKRTMARN